MNPFQFVDVILPLNVTESRLSISPKAPDSSVLTDSGIETDVKCVLWKA